MLIIAELQSVQNMLEYESFPGGNKAPCACLAFQMGRHFLGSSYVRAEALERYNSFRGIEMELRVAVILHGD